MIFFDFEYNEHQVLLCVAQKGANWFSFDFRNGRQTQEFADWVRSNKMEVFASYAVSAEIESMLRLGLQVDNLKFVDLMAECKMITMSHDAYFTADASMLGQVRAILKKDITEDAAHKEKMRELILSKNEWNGEEWDEIELYCYSDIIPLKDLWEKIKVIHQQGAHPYSIQHAIHRGEYIRKATEMDFASRGFPVYGGDVEKIYGNRERIKDAIILNLPYYWKACYEKNKDGKWTLRRRLITQLIDSRGWVWKKTDNGGPCLEADYLDELRVSIPEVTSLYTAVRSLTTLNSADLREQIREGYIKTKTFAFSAKTGRNGLKPKHGVLLNLPSWMRKIVHPHPGMALIGVDWSQQEIAIAAALSSDEKLLDAYNSGDMYLTLGKVSGSIPQDGTKQTHAVERQLFKGLQLGLGYGKGQKSLGAEFYSILKDKGVSETDARIRAKEAYNWHKSYFSQYWAWIKKQLGSARMNGWISTSDNWICWVSRRTLDTQLLNFPSQSGGAVMMRIATGYFYDLWKAGYIEPLLCSQHDGFYFNIPEEKVAEQLPLIKEVMKQASIACIGTEVRVDAKIFTNENSYVPDHFEARHEQLWNLAIGE